MFGRKSKGDRYHGRHHEADAGPVTAELARVTGEDRASMAIAALNIYHQHRGEALYNRPYLQAYKGLITFEEADEQIILLAMNDAQAQMGGPKDV